MQTRRLCPFVLVLASILGAGCNPKKPTDFMEESLPGRAPLPARVGLSHCADSMASQIDFEPKPTTIRAILALPRPADLSEDISTPYYQDRRVAPFETTVWRITAKLLRLVVRPDGDIYLVLEDSAHRQIVAEVPPPAATKGTLVEVKTRKVFELLTKMHRPTMAPKDVGREVTLEGIGFFGKSSNREGAPHSGARLMPILAIKEN